MVAFHELTHDYQKLMMADGKINSSSMSYILNSILRKNQSKCFTPVDRKRRPIRDKDGKVLSADYYKANHDSDEIEIQADEEAWRQCRKFIHKHEIRPFQGSDDTKRKEGREHWEKCLDREREVSARRAFCLKGDEFGNNLSYIQYDIQELKKYIGNNPDTLKSFPQLESYFDSKGNIRPDIFFNQSLAAIDYAALDAQTDNFGVELATYAITDETTTKQLLEYIRNNPLSRKQALRCTSNLWNILHQDALKMRAIKKVDYSSYDYTRTRGVDISVPDLRKSYLKQYLHQLYNCVRVSYMLKQRCPDAISEITEEESKYFSAYYPELAKDVTLEPSYTSMVKTRYMKSGQPVLQNIARSMV
jgi:hypothetical protein